MSNMKSMRYGETVKVKCKSNLRCQAEHETDLAALFVPFSRLYSLHTSSAKRENSPTNRGLGEENTP